MQTSVDTCSCGCSCGCSKRALVSGKANTVISIVHVLALSGTLQVLGELMRPRAGGYCAARDGLGVSRDPDFTQNTAA